MTSCDALGGAVVGCHRRLYYYGFQFSSNNWDA